MLRFTRGFAAILVLSAGVLCSRVAYAQESTPSPRLDLRAVSAALPAPSYAVLLAEAADEAQTPWTSAARPRIVERGATAGGWKSALFALDAMTVGMQLADYHSTVKVLQMGGAEANPLMSGLVSNRTAFLGAKLGIAAGLMFATHNMATHNKVAAVLTSVAANSAYLYITQRNYRIATQMQR